jgi:serine/threonine-protein kinase HipA
VSRARVLLVLLDEVSVGVLEEGRAGRLSFSYEPGWQDHPAARSLSLSLPYTTRTHTHRPVHAFLSNLLPDRREVLDRWGRQFGVSGRNPFALLTHMGEDCAGACQFVREDRLVEVMEGEGSLEPLSEEEVAGALERIRRNLAPWPDTPDRKGMFSLAGSQSKLALARTPAGWARPTGRVPTTHILKPPTDANFPGIEVNEHVCLELARVLGIPAAASRVVRFGGEVAMVVTRYDRMEHGDRGIIRVHQEDACQALGLPPARKYQHDQGPGFAELAGLARDHSTDPDGDLGGLLGAAAFNWVIAGTDAHAKNYSWFIGHRDGIRLAPLYDLISSLPYYDLEEDDLRLAMTVGGENRFAEVRARHWAAFARVLDADEGGVRDYVHALAMDVPPALDTVIHNAAVAGLASGVLSQVGAAIRRNAERCEAILRP